MKEIYIKPETIQRKVLLENLFNNLSSDGRGNWTQTLNDDDQESEDEGRTKERGLWEDALW
jgi:hypothetical protein